MNDEVDYEVKFEDLKGKIINKILVSGSSGDDDVIKFCTDEGDFELYHEQVCCEDVYIEDICGDLDDLIGTPILNAGVRTNNNFREYDPDDSSTWTFYLIDSIKGSVTIRWIGKSNGNYSEEVDIAFYKNHGIVPDGDKLEAEIAAL